jgi:hypothetical protein
VARLATQTPRRVPDSGPLTEGPGPTSSPGSLPATRVACRCSLVGFDRQHVYYFHTNATNGHIVVYSSAIRSNSANINSNKQFK